jgi:hypothetical protein
MKEKARRGVLWRWPRRIASSRIKRPVVPYGPYSIQSDRVRAVTTRADRARPDLAGAWLTVGRASAGRPSDRTARAA